MEYRISNICSDLSIGKSTVYKRIELLKQNIPETSWKDNDYYYYDKNNKLFITEKGFEYIKNFNSKNINSNEFRQNSTSDSISIYQNQIIDIYKQRIEYLENENKRLLDIVSVKEQKELAKDMQYIGNNKNISFLDKLFYKFKKS